MMPITVKSPQLLKRCGSWIACLIGYHGDTGIEGQRGRIGREMGKEWCSLIGLFCLPDVYLINEISFSFFFFFLSFIFLGVAASILCIISELFLSNFVIKERLQEN